MFILILGIVIILVVVLILFISRAHMHSKRLEYLTAVYPAGKESLQKLSQKDLEDFYNKLWFYYNCESEFKGKVMDRRAEGQVEKMICWQKLPGCGSKYPKLPHAPVGYMYSFRDWNESHTPFIWSDGKSIQPKNILASVPGQTFWYPYTGPAPVWMFQRAIFRYIYADKSSTTAGAFTYPSILPGPIKSLKPAWNSPEQWWLGVPDNGYMEISGASEPGIASSPPMVWYDGWVGSGMFVNVGRSLRVRNKVDACWQLCAEMVSKGYQSQLQQWFNSSDPDTIILNLVSTQSDNIHCQTGKVTLWNDKTNSKDEINWCVAGFWNYGSVPNNYQGWDNVYAFYVPDRSAWCQSGRSCVEQMRFGLNYQADRQASIMTFDEPIFLLGNVLGYDTVQMTVSANGSGFWQYEILELRNYPPEVKQRDYSQFIHFTQDNNGTIVYSYNPDFVQPYLAQLSQYLSLRDPLDPQNDSKSLTCVTLPWNPNLFPKNFKERQWLKEDSWEYNITCDKGLSNMFDKTSIYGGPDNQCSPNGIGFAGRPMKTADDAPYG